MAAAKEKVYDLRQPAFLFAVRIVKLCQFLDKNTDVNKWLTGQLLDAGTSVGANLEEAGAGQSPKDFVHKNAIALKEAREAQYWLKLLRASYELEPLIEQGIIELIQESSELGNIVGKIVVNAKNNIK